MVLYATNTTARTTRALDGSPLFLQNPAAAAGGTTAPATDVSSDAPVEVARRIPSFQTRADTRARVNGDFGVRYLAGRLQAGATEGLAPADPVPGGSSADTELEPDGRPGAPKRPDGTGIDTYNTAPTWAKVASAAARPAYEAAGLTISTYFKEKGYENAHALIDHYRDASGEPYELKAGAVDQFVADPSADVPGEYQGPALWHERAKQRAIEEAVAKAKADPSLYGKPQQITTPWETVRANTDQDALLSVGTFQASLTASVIVHPPGPNGESQVEIASKPHLFDVYDFDNQGTEALGDHQKAASQFMHKGNLLGYFRAFEVNGSGTTTRETVTYQPPAVDEKQGQSRNVPV